MSGFQSDVIYNTPARILYVAARRHREKVCSGDGTVLSGFYVSLLQRICRREAGVFFSKLRGYDAAKKWGEGDSFLNILEI